MREERLNNLTLMSLEHEVLRAIDVRLIDKFAKVKSRKMPPPSQSTFAAV